MIQIGGVYTTFCQEGAILLQMQKYRDRNGRSIAILFKSIGVGGRFDSPGFCRLKDAVSAIAFPLCLGCLYPLYSITQPNREETNPAATAYCGAKLGEAPEQFKSQYA